jgi:hypothetical protein
MSDDFHRPTYTSAKEAPNGDLVGSNEDGHYNPTQVRLYGIRADLGRVLANEALTLSVYKTRVKAEIALDKLSGYGTDPGEWAEQLGKHIEIVQAFLERFNEDRDESALKNFSFADFPWPVKGKEYRASLDTRRLGALSLYAGQLPPEYQGAEETVVSTGVIFGYAYEGHTYDFVKPKLMFLPTHPLVSIPKDDSGFDLKQSEGYKVWIVDKLDRCIEIDINQGFIDELVLEANLPGKRSPTMYGAKMALAHRGGS